MLAGKNVDILFWRRYAAYRNLQQMGGILICLTEVLLFYFCYILKIVKKEEMFIPACKGNRKEQEITGKCNMACVSKLSGDVAGQNRK